MNMIKTKKGEIELGPKASMIVLVVAALVMFAGFFWLADKFGYIEHTETTKIYCSDGTIEIWNGSGYYCGEYADSLKTIEEKIKAATPGVKSDIDLDIYINKTDGVQ